MTTGADITAFSGDVIQLQTQTTPSVVVDSSVVWSQSVIDKLNLFCRLEEGWDGYNGKPVRLSTANFVIKMLERIYQPNFPEPQLVPGSNGDVQIEWHLEGLDLELHCLSPYNVIAWRETEATGEDGEEVPIRADFRTVMNWMNEYMEADIAPHAATA